MSTCGVLLINLGTPSHCTSKAVKKYLREFLQDPRVIDLPRVLRWLLVNSFIIPLRYRKTTHAYQQIWSSAGSPLRHHSEKTRDALAKKLGDHYQVQLAMRYGQPDIASTLREFKQIDSLIIIPLFPQYSSAATGSAMEQVFNDIKKNWNIPKVTVINDFWHQPGFINAYAEIIRAHLQGIKIDKLVFSYHGLPQRHIYKSDCRLNCINVNPCPDVHRKNRFCYRAQCYATSTAIAQQLDLEKTAYHVAFQSRLGRTPWIKPYTDLLLPEFIRDGIKRIAIVSPSFVADCLETLEEINIRTRKQWMQLGGESFHFIPCLNDHPLWINALADMIAT